MGRRTTVARVVLAMALIASFLVVPVVSAQANEMLRGTWTLIVPVPDPGVERGFTAADDLWTWRESRDRTTIQTGRILTTLERDRIEGNTAVRVWDDTDIVHAIFSMEVNHWYVPDLDSDSSGMLTLSGKSDGRLRFVYSTGTGDERAPGALTWTGNLTGEGTCVGAECTVVLEITGKLGDPDGKRNCGDFSLQVGSVINHETQSWKFTDVSSEVVSTAITELRTTKKDGLACDLSDSEPGTKTGDVRFYYGPKVDDGERPGAYSPTELTVIGSGGRVLQPYQVMPGDNVRLDFMNIPIQMRQQLIIDNPNLWDPQLEPLQVYQDMQIQLSFSGRRNEELRISGNARVRFGGDVYAQGKIQGTGVLDSRLGLYKIQMIRDFDIMTGVGRNAVSCGTMQLSANVTLMYINGDPDRPIIVGLLPNGSGSISVLDDVRCLLESLEVGGDT